MHRKTTWLHRCVCLLLLTSADRVLGGEIFTFHHEHVLGTSLELQVHTDSADAAEVAESNVLSEIERLSAIFSGYDPSSEVSQWAKTLGQPNPVSSELFGVLEECAHWRRITRGAFDPGVHAVTLLWKKAEADNAPPARDTLDRATTKLRQAAWALDRQNRTALRLSTGPLNLDGIAKGYIIDRACEVALSSSQAIEGVLVNIGGDLRVAGDLTRRVGIANPHDDSDNARPLATIQVHDRAAATSGGYRRGFEIAGRWYSHIIDPRTGMPVDHVSSVTVVARRAMDADVLATAFSVLPVQESLELADSLSDIECMLVTKQGVRRTSRGWHSFARELTKLVASADTASADMESVQAGGTRQAATPAGWNTDFELAVDFEINRPRGGGYRRPYVAVWVEGKSRFPVRTLLLFVRKPTPGPRWFRDLHRWYRHDQERKSVDGIDVVDAVASATRPPGKYKVVWDGKDNHGTYVDAGSYTILIEAARENGTYQLMRERMEFSGKPVTVKLDGNAEIKSAVLDYRPKKN